jgi:hypothetical protein
MDKDIEEFVKAIGAREPAPGDDTYSLFKKVAALPSRAINTRIE